MRTRWCALLNDVRQLMRQEASSCHRLRCVLPPVEHHVTPYGESQRVDSLRRPCCLVICVHPNMAEVVTEARLEKSAHRRRERLTVATRIADVRVGCV